MKKKRILVLNNLLRGFVLTGIFLSAFLTEGAFADEVINIVSPEEGEIFAPGETITVEVEPAPGTDLDVVFVGFPKTLGYEASDTTEPYELELTLPDDVIGSVVIESAAHGEDESDVFSDSVEIQLQPEGELISLTVTPLLDVEMSFLGDKEDIQVRGTFADQTVAFLNGPEFGTTYQTQSGTENVIAVSDNGVVTAQGNGEDAVIVSNDDLSKEVKFNVNITNTLPVLNPVENQILEAEVTKEFTVTASDSDGDDLQYRFFMPEYGSTVDHGDGTATVTFTPQTGDVGSLFFWDFHIVDNGNPPLAKAHATRFIKVLAGPIPPPSLAMNLSLNATEPVEPGEDVTVSWRVEYAASCEGQEGLSGELKALGGGYVVVNPEVTTTYVVECTGPGGTTSDSRTVEVAGSPVNQAPIITSGPTADDDEILENTTTTVSVDAYDPDGDELNYDWDATGGSVIGTGEFVTYQAPRVRRDTSYTVSVEITDGRGGLTTGSVDILVENKTSGGGGGGPK